MAEQYGYRIVSLKNGGQVDVTMINGHPNFVVEATLQYNGQQWSLPLDGPTKLAAVKAKATRFANKLDEDLARQASLKAGLPRQVPDDVKPVGCLL